MSRRLQSRPSFLGVAVLFLALILRLELLATRSLWIDEALSLDVAALGPGGIVKLSRTAEPHPPAYYLMLWAWQIAFGDSVVTARVLSLLFGLATVLLTWILGDRLFGEAVGLSAASLVALHPFQLFASNEIRMYPLLATLGLGATTILAEAVARRDHLTLWVAYGVLAAAIAYTSYYGLLLLAGHGVAMLAVFRGRRAWRGPLASAAVALACYFPWLPSLLPSVTSNPVPWRPQFTWTYPVEILISQTFGGHLLGTPAYQDRGLPSPLWTVMVAPFVALLLLGGRTAVGSNGGVVLLASWLVPVVLVVVASAILNKVAAYQYHLSYLQPYAACLLALGGRAIVYRVRTHERRATALGLVILVLGYVGPAAVVVQRGEREVYRFDAAARWLNARQARGDVTMYYVHTGHAVLRRYLASKGPEIVISVSAHRWTLEENRELLRGAVALLGAQHKRVWLVLTPPFPPGSVEELIRLLGERGYRAGGRGVAFGEVRIQLFERRR